MGGHSHTRYLHWKPTVEHHCHQVTSSCHLSITNRKSSHRYPNRHTTNILYCHTQSQPVMHWPNSLKYCHTGYTATHNTPSLRCHQPLIHTATYTVTIPQANSKLLSVLSHTSGSQQGVVPQLNVFLIYISFIICLSASLVVSVTRAHPHTYAHTTHSRRVWARVCRAGRGSCPRRWRSGLCPDQGGSRSPEDDVERPRGAVRGRARRRQPRRGGGGGAQPPATTQTDRCRRRWVRAPPGGWPGTPQRAAGRCCAPRGWTAGGRGLLAPGRMLKAQSLRIPCGSGAVGAPAPASGRLSEVTPESR